MGKAKQKMIDLNRSLVHAIEDFDSLDVSELIDLLKQARSLIGDIEQMEHHEKELNVLKSEYFYLMCSAYSHMMYPLISSCLDMTTDEVQQRVKDKEFTQAQIEEVVSTLKGT